MGGMASEKGIYYECIQQNVTSCAVGHACKDSNLLLCYKTSYGEVFCIFPKKFYCKNVLLEFAMNCNEFENIGDVFKSTKFASELRVVWKVIHEVNGNDLGRKTTGSENF